MGTTHPYDSKDMMPQVSTDKFAAKHKINIYQKQFSLSENCLAFFALLIVRCSQKVCGDMDFQSL
jgi:hypothetical protein